MAWPNLVSLSTSSRNRRRPRRHGRWELASAHCCATEGIRASPCAPSLFPCNPSTPVPLARFSPPRVRPRPKTQSPPPHRCRGHRASRGLIRRRVGLVYFDYNHRFESGHRQTLGSSRLPRHSHRRRRFAPPSLPRARLCTTTGPGEATSSDSLRSPLILPLI